MSAPESLIAALADRYILDRELGRGGMATVYLARDVRHARQVAIKVLHPELAAVLGAERFLAEITTTANLQHPHILPLFDSGSADGQLFYVMPFVEGETLRARLDRETQLPIADAVQLAREVADALQYAHERGVIHRDIKPENILLQGGHAVVADFGIALAVQQAGGQRMTQTGLSLGTPQYMAPEQAMGEKSVSARADIYALGAVTYEMLVGEPPFTGPTAQAIVARVLTTTPAPVAASRATVPLHIDAAVRTALAKLPADRQATARDFAAQLSGAATMANAAPERATRAVTTSRGTRVALAVTSLVAIAATATAAYFATRRQAEAPARVFVLQLPESAQVSDRNVQRRVAISADGRRVYYTGDYGRDRSGLFARDVADTLPQPIVGTELASSPVPCPGGRWLYFSRGVNIERVSLEGGAPSTVLEGGTVSDCNEVGDLLVSRQGQLLLWREGKPLRRLAVPDSSRGEIFASLGAFLPGGTHAVYTITGGLGESMIAVVPLEGGARQLLDLPGRAARYANGHLLFVRDNELLAVPFDPRRLELRGTPVPIATEVSNRVRGADFAVSSDGTLVYVSGSLGNLSRLAKVDRSGREVLLDREPLRYSWPRMSPDGARIAVEVGTGRGAFDVWLLTIASRSIERVTNNFAGVRPIGWSRDGRRIAYLANDTLRSAARRRTIAWVPWDQSAPPTLIRVVVPDGSGVEDASVNELTGLIAVRTGGYGRHGDLWLAPPAVPGDSLRRARPLTVTSADEETPRLSPDGRWVAYASNETGTYELYARASDGVGGRMAISAGPGTEPVWTPDGRGLYYRGVDRMMYAALRTGSAAGAGLEVVRRDTLFADTYRREKLTVSYDVFPDGQALLMQKPNAVTSRQPVIVLNWPALLRQRAAREQVPQ